MIIFDLTNSLFKCWFRLEFCCLNCAVILICSGFSSNEVISDTFMAVEAIIFRWLYLISLIDISNVVPGSSFATPILLFVLSRSKFLSKDVVILDTSNFDGSLTHISLITSVASERHVVFELRVTCSSTIFFGSWCCWYIFLVVRNLIRWRSIGLGFSIKVILRRWMFRFNSKQLIFNGSWWKLYQFIVVYFLELYQCFLLFFKLW